MDKQERERLRRDVWSRPDNWRGTETALYGPFRGDLFVRMNDFERLQVLASRLLDALDAAEQRAEAAERDAARYRWVLPIVTDGDECDARTLAVGMALFRGLDGDAAIDAAMGEQTGEGGGNASR